MVFGRRKGNGLRPRGRWRRTIWEAPPYDTCLRLPAARLSATHDNLRVASLLRYGCHRLTMICASLTLLQIMFAGATCVRCCDFSSLATARNDELKVVAIGIAALLPRPRPHSTEVSRWKRRRLDLNSQISTLYYSDTTKTRNLMPESLMHRRPP